MPNQRSVLDTEPARDGPLTGPDEPRVVRWMVRAMTVIVVVSLAAGLLAAAIGGSLEELGSGPGGLYGLPNALLTLLVLVATVPVARSVGRSLQPERGWLRRAVLVTLGAWVVAVGYFIVAHIVDPCLNGWWDAASRIGSQRLCERYGAELNWHPRFHLLAHAAPAALMLAIYVLALRRRPAGQ